MLVKKQRIPIVQMVFIGFLPSIIKKIIYRIRGHHIGKNVRIGIGSVVIGKKVSIGANTRIGFLSVLRAKEIQIERFVRIGSMVFIDTERIFIDDDSRINENVIVGGIKFPDSYLHLGKRTIIMEYSFINPTKPIVIGDDSGIGGHCLLFTHGSWLPQTDGYPVAFAPITMGKRVWLPWRVFIMPGVTIGDDVVVGANSLITKSIPANCLVAGFPAKIIKDDYPSPLTPEKRNSIVNSIFNDFESYLVYHSFKVHSESDSQSKIILVQRSNNSYKLKYLSQSIDTSSNEEFDLVIIDNEQLDLQNFKAHNKMVVDLRKKDRVGTSELGEEFVSFISRYGIRFNRLD